MCDIFLTWSPFALLALQVVDHILWVWAVSIPVEKERHQEATQTHLTEADKWKGYLFLFQFPLII